MVAINITVGYRSSGFQSHIKNFQLRGGHVIGVLGTNGCGKSTFYKTLIGEIPPLEGFVPDKLKDEIAIVSDQVNIPDDCKVGTLTSLIKESNLIASKKRYEKMSSFVESVSNRKVNSLSSGQKRILQIFLMLASDKRVIIMDEACSFLDLKNKMLVFDAIKNITEVGATVLYTSHELDDFESLDAELYFFSSDGLVLYEGDASPSCLRQMLIDCS